jgi:hypothetical protein
MKPEERDAVIEECAKVCDLYADRAQTALQRNPSAPGEYMSGRSNCAEDCADAIRALTAQSPAGVPPEPTADREELLGDAIRALIAGRIKCSDDLPPEQRPISPSARKAFGCVYKLVRAANSAGVPTTEPVAPIARDWMSRNVNEFASHFLRQYDKTTSVRESMMYAFVQTYDAPQAPAEPVAQEPVARSPYRPEEARLWEALGQWTVTIAQGGVHAELAPPQYVLDAVSALSASPISLPVEADDEIERLRTEIADAWRIAKHWRERVQGPYDEKQSTDNED